MRTNFNPAQLEDPQLAAAEKQLRACVHCGICTATCPTYVLLGDELDGPRGRIQLIQHMLETDATPSAKVVTHIDRCLSCLACVSACPSGVNYPRLIDKARDHIERKATRPWPRRLLREMLGKVLPRRDLLRPLLALGRIGASFVLAPAQRTARPRTRRRALAGAGAHVSHPAHLAPERQTDRPRRACIWAACKKSSPRASPAPPSASSSATATKSSTVEGTGCCGALNHHLGQTAEAHRHADRARRRHRAPRRRRAVRRHRHDSVGLRQRHPRHRLPPQRRTRRRRRHRARATSPTSCATCRCKTGGRAHRSVRVAYHAACSLTHGMKQAAAAPQILRALGFDVVEPRDTLCCGSAGVYNVLEPDIADRLQERKAATLMETTPKFIATGNIGCLTQIASAVNVPVVHPIELIDWATGGSRP